MKKISKVILLAALCSLAIPSWAQSTQGKEFWVSSTIVCSPDKTESNRTPAPYIAISAEKACTVKIQGGLNNDINITLPVAAGSWNEFGNSNKEYNNTKPYYNNNPNQGPINVQMDASKWYPTHINASNQVRTLAGQKNMYGLHITATEDVSVYVILSTLNSMDASNVLPVTAIGSEYYTQDYWPIVKSDWDNTVTMATILATEDGTQVDIIPNGNTYDGHQSGTLYTVDLVKGQTYYLMSEADKQLTGTHIQARSGKKIAVFNGVPLTNLPTDIAARDGLFEQSMPVEYWGTQFIVTRSLGKNGNLIGITATQRSTEIKVDGYSQAIIGEGDTYYIMLQGANDPNGNKPGTSPIDLVVTADAAFIETSCPCAVYNYDTGNGYKGKNENDTDGDPSSVWVSPVQQKINRITFGTCYTKKTNDHFLNVVTETATCQQTKLTALYGATKLDKSNLLVWTPVPGNTTYSYARAKIGDANTKQYSVFRLENSHGVIATVYGNGDDESYAYSAGSAAVEQGVNVNGITFTNGFRSDDKFCILDSLNFDAKVGTDEIARVDWDFGDGTSEDNGDPQTFHKYTTPGWFDVSADLYGRKVCTNENDKWLGTVQFSFRVVRADTIPADYQPSPICLTVEQQADIIATKGQAHLDSMVTFGELTILNPDAPCYEDKLMCFQKYGLETEVAIDSTVRDGITINGHYFDADTTIQWDEDNEYGCPRHVTYNLTVITCLHISVSNDSLHVCPGEDLSIPYKRTRGHIQDAQFEVYGLVNGPAVYDDTKSNGSFIVPTTSITQAGKYHGTLTIEDRDCDSTIVETIDFAVYYPSDIFNYKFNNVLAVYKNGYGGNDGYDFVSYQWYVNDMPVPGATESVYYQDEPFNYNDKVYVVLTDKRGVELPSCPKYITVVPDYTPDAAQVPARKLLIDKRLMIERDGVMFDIYGQKVR